MDSKGQQNAVIIFMFKHNSTYQYSQTGLIQ